MAYSMVRNYPTGGFRWENRVDRELQALYSQVLAGARISRIWSRLRGKSRGLRDFDHERAKGSLQRSYYAGIQTVRMKEIQGSAGRSADFDEQFRPVQDGTRERWIRVAAALQNGKTLPPVELIRIGQIYFVKDGHHRISASRALGQEYIEAEVTVLDIVLN